MITKFSFFILLQILAISFSATQTNKQLPNEIPLPSLTNVEFLSNQTYILTFYTPWCQDSAKILQMMLQLHQDYQKINIPFKFFKVDGTKQKELAKRFNIQGFPSIRLINKNKWGEEQYKEYIYDIKKAEFQYFLEREFGIIPHFNSAQQFEQSKSEYQIVLSADKTIYQDVYQQFFNASFNHSLYTFNTINPHPEFYKNYWIPLDEEDIADSCYILLLQRPNNYDKRLDCSFMRTQQQLIKQGKQEEANQLLQKFKNEFDKFLQTETKPWMFYKFNHKIREFIMEKGFWCVALFSRKKTKQIEKITRDTYLNGTRDLKYEMKVKQNTNFQQFYGEFVDNTQFLFLDIEKPMERRLAHFIGIEDQEVPIVVAFYFDKQKKEIIKFKSSKQQFYFINFIPEAASALHAQNQDYSSFKRVIKFDESKKPIAKGKKQTNIWNLNYWNMERFFNLKLPRSVNVPTIWVIIYTASYCIHSKKQDILFTNLAHSQQEIFNHKTLNINFGKAELYGQDFPTKYGKIPDKVPEIRVYRNETVFEVVEPKNQKEFVKAIIKENKEFLKEDYKKDEL